jgi:hypothetical protein
MLFHDLFNGESAVHKMILEFLATGAKTLSQVHKKLGRIDDIEQTKVMLDNLYICGFVRRHSQVPYVQEKKTDEKLYTLWDPYVRFYLKFMESRSSKMEEKEGQPDLQTVNIPGFDGIIGIAMETLLIQNSVKILEALDIHFDNVELMAPYFQRAEGDVKGCQIDYLIQDNENRFFSCEFKFSSKPLTKDIIAQIQEKLSRLVVPPNATIIPCLFHIGGVEKEVLESNYFYRIIDIAAFLEG